MQVLKHSSILIHPLFNELERFYTATSEKVAANRLVEYEFDESLKPLQDMFNEYGGTNYNFKFVDKGYKKIDLPKFDESNLLVCFSGGKDSTATAIKYADMGYNIYLYHSHGMNAGLWDEIDCVNNLSDILEMPLIVENTTLSGHHDWVEHPLKNIMIATYCLNYGIVNGISDKIIFGNYISSYIEDSVFGNDVGDSVDMWEVYDDIISKIIPDFAVEIALDNLVETIDILGAEDDILGFTLSCTGRAGLRKYNANKIQSKYNVKLINNRCGMCPKCCMEYVYRVDRDIIPYNKAYYEYCLNRLKATMKKDGVVNPTLDDVWQNYFLYDKSKSKYFGVKV